MALYRVKTDELYHYGIKGQKWYVRRYQNEDGTLTEAGKARYGNTKGLSKDELKRIDFKAGAAGSAMAIIPGQAGAWTGYFAGNAIGGATGGIIGTALIGGIVGGTVCTIGKKYVSKQLISKEFANKNPDTMNTGLGKKYAEDILNNRKAKGD